jgi:hypothetical protein
MKLPKMIRNFIAVAVLLSIAAWLAGCSKMGGKNKDPNVDYYTCTMHPSVKSQDPNGKCPICSMDLVPVMKKGAGAGSSGAQHDATGMPMGEAKTASGPMFSEFSVPVERQQQIRDSGASSRASRATCKSSTSRLPVRPCGKVHHCSRFTVPNC